MPVSLVTMPLRAPLLCALPPSPTFAADELPRCRTGADGRTLPAEFSDEALADPGRARAGACVRELCTGCCTPRNGRVGEAPVGCGFSGALRAVALGGWACRFLAIAPATGERGVFTPLPVPPCRFLPTELAIGDRGVLAVLPMLPKRGDALHAPCAFEDDAGAGACAFGRDAFLDALPPCLGMALAREFA